MGCKKTSGKTIFFALGQANPWYTLKSIKKGSSCCLKVLPSYKLKELFIWWRNLGKSQVYCCLSPVVCLVLEQFCQRHSFCHIELIKKFDLFRKLFGVHFFNAVDHKIISSQHQLGNVSLRLVRCLFRLPESNGTLFS